jgi:hypothetical protein
VAGDHKVRVQPAPTARDGVDVGAAHAAKVDVEGDVVRTGGLERVGLDGKVGVVFGVYSEVLARASGARDCLIVV